MFPPFSQEVAYHYCTKLISKIEDGSIVLKKISQESEERKDLGLMLGCLVGYREENLERVIVYAISGNRFEMEIPKNLEKREKEKYLIAPSIVSYKEIQEALKENDEEIHFLTKKINELEKKIKESSKEDLASKKDLANKEDLTAKEDIYSLEKISLENKRKILTTQSLKKVHSLYTFYRFDQKKVQLQKLIECNGQKLPPTGTGDCCEPKLLCFAFKNHIRPISMTEIYYGKSKNKKSLFAYPPCDERCSYILPELLGLEILYKDKDIVVASKKSGLLSVPGRGKDKEDSAESRIRFLYQHEIEKDFVQIAAHRLDMETSGLMIFALNKRALEALHTQFRNKTVLKTYTALLDGILYGKNEGHIEMKTRLDVDNRPHQIFDEKNGKLGITDWKKLRVETLTFTDKNGNEGKKKVTRIQFLPKTGRTHQLRIASADSHGLGIPIVGDSLYGKADCKRLYLHAQKITFEHPTSKRILTFESETPF